MANSTTLFVKHNRYNKKAADPMASELDKRDYADLAKNLRMEIDDGRVGRDKRKERLEKEQKDLAIEIEAIEKEETEAKERLDGQQKQIDDFKTEELKGDVVEMEAIQKEKKEIEAQELVILKRAEQEEEEHLAASGGVVSGDDGSITERLLSIYVYEAKDIIACDKPGKNRAKWTSDPYCIVSFVKQEEGVNEPDDDNDKGNGKRAKALTKFKGVKGGVGSALSNVKQKAKDFAERGEDGEDAAENENNDEEKKEEPKKIEGEKKEEPAAEEEEEKIQYKYIPIGSEKGQTKAIKKTLNPVWDNEVFNLGGKKDKSGLIINLNKVYQPMLQVSKRRRAKRGGAKRLLSKVTNI